MEINFSLFWLDHYNFLESYIIFISLIAGTPNILFILFLFCLRIV